VFHEQVINFLEAAVVFLLLTNAVSAAAATYAIRMLKLMTFGQQETGNVVERKIDGILRRVG
jgi:hypothetical protein